MALDAAKEDARDAQWTLESVDKVEGVRRFDAAHISSGSSPLLAEKWSVNLEHPRGRIEETHPRTLSNSVSSCLSFSSLRWESDFVPLLPSNFEVEPPAGGVREGEEVRGGRKGAMRVAGGGLRAECQEETEKVKERRRGGRGKVVAKSRNEGREFIEHTLGTEEAAQDRKEERGARNEKRDESRTRKNRAAAALCESEICALDIQQQV